jgi:hypothetical protein
MSITVLTARTDHVLGRPSLQFRKYQVLTVLLFWSIYLLRGNKHGPPIPLLRRMSRFFSKRITPFQTVTLTLLYLYVSRNFAKLFNLESPEPLANLYTRSYFRATWIMTALDAGFWTAMRIRKKWIREACSVLFSIYYLFAAERADEKVYGLASSRVCAARLTAVTGPSCAGNNHRRPSPSVLEQIQNAISERPQQDIASQPQPIRATATAYSSSQGIGLQGARQCLALLRRHPRRTTFLPKRGSGFPRRRLCRHVATPPR